MNSPRPHGRGRKLAPFSDFERGVVTGRIGGGGRQNRPERQALVAHVRLCFQPRAGRIRTSSAITATVRGAISRINRFRSYHVRLRTPWRRSQVPPARIKLGRRFAHPQPVRKNKAAHLSRSRAITFCKRCVASLASLGCGPAPPISPRQFPGRPRTRTARRPQVGDA